MTGVLKREKLPVNMTTQLHHHGITRVKNGYTQQIQIYLNYKA